VQGVGFRPFVYRLASSLHLGGFVRNQSGKVQIEIEGDAPTLDRFLEEVRFRPPRLAHIEDVIWSPQPLQGEQAFRVDESRDDGLRDTIIAADVATCQACRQELLDPTDRRYRYPFLNCTDCGPRLTVVTGAPYDRERTTMAAFDLCSECRAEYENPLDRRFHAQPTACARCGPRLSLLDPSGRAMAGEEEPLAVFVRLIRQGLIGALKSLGGYHLTCDARREAGVALLRRRKGRERKPFALMVRSADDAARLCHLSARERTLLESRRAPIVLLERRSGGFPRVASQVAPGRSTLGVMLPSAPIHHLLFQELGGVPLVMTSGNRSDEPIAIDETALQQLNGIADAFLVHDRPIHVRSDDSVTRIIDDDEAPIRRSRGYAPEPVSLPMESVVPTLAVGGQLKSTFALSRGRKAFLSHHLGDLDLLSAQAAFVRDIEMYESLFGIRPIRIVHDLHPQYISTEYACDRADREGLHRVEVQHHHAHMASCMAENGLEGPVLGVTFDGTGFGTDGTLWGGEFLIGDYRHFRRAAHLEQVPMPGGDQAIREPWRMAVAYLLDAGGDTGRMESRVPAASIAVVRRMIEQRLHCPMTSSMGRLFDGAASLLGVRDRVSYEGEAAIELETLARRSFVSGSYPIDFLKDGDRRLIRTGPILAAIGKDLDRGVPTPDIARRFHATVVEMIRETLLQLRKESGLAEVVLSGGVFQNELLLRETLRTLRREDFRVYRHRLVPSNDGGISLGQLAVAAAREGS
jgi:hydrogenase maturation protein HypF